MTKKRRKKKLKSQLDFTNQNLPNFIRIQSNLSIPVYTPAVPGKSVRYYRDFQYFAKKRGKKDMLMHNNVLNLTNTVTGKRVNRGAGRLGLEKPMDYTFYGDARVILWLEKAFNKITENIGRC